MSDAQKEYMEALYELRRVTVELREQSLLTRDAVAKVINDGYLRSTLTLLKEDLGLLRLINR